MGIISKKIILELKERTVWGKRVPHSRNSVCRASLQQREIAALKERTSRRQCSTEPRSQVWLGHRQALVWRMQVNSEARGNQRGISRRRVTDCGISEVLFVCFTSTVLFLKDHVGCT